MNSVLMTFKVDSGVKHQAQEVARSMGLTLSDLVRGILYYIVRRKTITFSALKGPTEHDVLGALKEAKRLAKSKRKP